MLFAGYESFSQYFKGNKLNRSPKVYEVGSDKLPKALGPYSMGKKVVYPDGDMYLYASG